MKNNILKMWIFFCFFVVMGFVQIEKLHNDLTEVKTELSAIQRIDEKKLRIMEEINDKLECINQAKTKEQIRFQKNPPAIIIK